MLYEFVLVGKDEDDNVEIFWWGELCMFDFEVKDYVDVVEGLNNGLDFVIVSKFMGSCFVVMCGDIVCLNCVIV